MSNPRKLLRESNAPETGALAQRPGTARKRRLPLSAAGLACKSDSPPGRARPKLTPY
jgi:hypothetical protein